MKKFLFAALAGLMLTSPLQAAPRYDDNLHVMLDHAGQAVLQGLIPANLGTGFVQADLAQGLITLEQHMTVPPVARLAAWLDATATHGDLRMKLSVPKPLPPQMVDLHLLAELRHHFATGSGRLLVNVPLHKTGVPAVHVALDSHGTLSAQHATLSLDVQSTDLNDLPEEATMHLAPDENGVVSASGDLRVAADSPLGRSVDDPATLEQRLKEQLESKLVEVQDLHVASQPAGNDRILHVTLRATFKPPTTGGPEYLNDMLAEMRETRVRTCDVHIVSAENRVQATVTLDVSGIEHLSMAGFKVWQSVLAKQHPHDDSRFHKLIRAEQALVFKQVAEAFPDAAHTDSPVEGHLTVDIVPGETLQVGVNGQLTGELTAADAAWARHGLKQLDAYHFELGTTAGESGVDVQLSAQSDGPFFTLLRDYYVQAAESIQDSEAAAALKGLSFDGARVAVSLQDNTFDSRGWLRLGGLSGLLHLVWDGGNLDAVRVNLEKGHATLMAWLSNVAPDRLKTALGKKIHNDFDIHRVQALPPVPSSTPVDVVPPQGLPVI